MTARSLQCLERDSVKQSSQFSLGLIVRLAVEGAALHVLKECQGQQVEIFCFRLFLLNFDLFVDVADFSIRQFQHEGVLGDAFNEKFAL